MGVEKKNEIYSFDYSKVYPIIDFNGLPEQVKEMMNSYQDRNPPVLIIYERILDIIHKHRGY